MTCLAEQLLNGGDTSALGGLFAALAATVTDPHTDAGRLALEDDFVSELSKLAHELGVVVDAGRFLERNPVTAAGNAAAVTGGPFAHADAAEAEYVRLFVCDRYGPQCPPWASYYTEGRLAGSSALRARNDETTNGGAVRLEVADAADRELGSLAILLLEGQREIGARYLSEHLSPWMASFAERLSDHAHLEHLRLAALLLGALFAPASCLPTALGVTA